MPSMVMIAFLQAKEGRESDVVAALERVVAQTHAEEGCEKYAVHQAQDDPTRFAIVEKWRDAEAFGAHMNSPHLAELSASMRDLLAEPPTGSAYNELGLGSGALGLL